MNRETLINALNSLDDDKLSNGDDIEIWKAITVIITALRFLLKGRTKTNETNNIINTGSYTLDYSYLANQGSSGSEVRGS